jgi:hypothetical protein
VGGVIAALAGPRIALGIAGAGSLVVTVTIWVVLRPRAGFHFLPAARAGSDAAHEGSGAASEGEPASFPSSERLV